MEKHKKNQTNVGRKWDESTKENIWEYKIDRIRSQQIREPCRIQPINEWVERRRRRREWNEHITRKDAERLVKISRDNIPAGRRSPGHPKEDGVT